VIGNAVRFTNTFGKKLENHGHAVALYALWYNFARLHKALPVSPAIAARIEPRLWSTADVVVLIDRREAPRRGTFLAD
jgi:hypothetical protein